MSSRKKTQSTANPAQTKVSNAKSQQPQKPQQSPQPQQNKPPVKKPTVSGVQPATKGQKPQKAQQQHAVDKRAIDIGTFNQKLDGPLKKALVKKTAAKTNSGVVLPWRTAFSPEQLDKWFLSIETKSGSGTNKKGSKTRIVLKNDETDDSKFGFKISSNRNIYAHGHPYGLGSELFDEKAEESGRQFYVAVHNEITDYVKGKIMSDPKLGQTKLDELLNECPEFMAAYKDASTKVILLLWEEESIQPEWKGMCLHQAKQALMLKRGIKYDQDEEKDIDDIISDDDPELDMAAFTLFYKSAKRGWEIRTDDSGKETTYITYNKTVWTSKQFDDANQNEEAPNEEPEQYSTNQTSQVGKSPQKRKKTDAKQEQQIYNDLIAKGFIYSPIRYWDAYSNRIPLEWNESPMNSGSLTLQVFTMRPYTHSGGREAQYGLKNTVYDIVVYYNAPQKVFAQIPKELGGFGEKYVTSHALSEIMAANADMNIDANAPPQTDEEMELASKQRRIMHNNAVNVATNQQTDDTNTGEPQTEEQENIEVVPNQQTEETGTEDNQEGEEQQEGEEISSPQPE
jgi:hypothetical protein